MSANLTPAIAIVDPSYLRRTSRGRRGFTLIESVVSIALLAVILTVVTLTLHTMYRADRRMRDELNLQSEFDRLATQLRIDTHPALAVTIAGPEDGSTAETLQLTLPGSQTVQYTLVADRVERTLRREEKTEHRESYRLPPSSGARWQVETERPMSMVSLVLEPQSTSELGGPALPYACRIDATVHLISPQPVSPGL